MEKFRNKIILTSSKWSSLNAPSTETPVSHSIWKNSIFLFSPLWGYKDRGRRPNFWTKLYLRGSGKNSMDLPNDKQVRERDADCRVGYAQFSIFRELSILDSFWNLKKESRFIESILFLATFCNYSDKKTKNLLKRQGKHAFYVKI